MSAAYRQADWKPDDVDLIECHATGTPVGDAVEVASLRELWQNIPPRQERCVIGSVKSNIGHLLTAAGAAALTKVLLAMQHQTLPPTASFNRPQPGMELDNSPFTVLTSGTFWQRRGDGIPRRAAVSAFGFGGINAHLLVEEWISPPPSSPRWGENASFPSPSGGESRRGSNPEPIAIVGMDASFGPWQGLGAVRQRLLGGDDATRPAPPQNGGTPEQADGSRSRDWIRRPSTVSIWTSLKWRQTGSVSPPKNWKRCCPSNF